MPYSELPTIGVVPSLGELDEANYLALNPDVRAAGLTAAEHFRKHGLVENRRQFINATAIEDVRKKKLKRVAFRIPTQGKNRSGPRVFISSETKAEFEIPDFPPIAANEYHPEIVDLIRQNPDALFLDLGAGLRHTYYSNVLNAEIWPSASTDVVCVAEDLPFKDEQFDHVICLAVLEHTKRPRLAAKEIVRVLRPGGHIRIDWPFLQPVHGYPYHYFNATLKGTVSSFEESCDIISSEVRPWQHPIFALTWMLSEWHSALPPAEQMALLNTTVGSLLHHTPTNLLNESFCSALPLDKQPTISAGTTLIARKR